MRRGGGAEPGLEGLSVVGRGSRQEEEGVKSGLTSPPLHQILASTRAMHIPQPSPGPGQIPFISALFN